jgi:opine dehydrogenase
MVTEKKVGVLGAGNAGYTIAYHLSTLGFEVALFEHPDFKQAVEPVQKTGEIVALEQDGEYKAVISGKAPIALATSDIKQVMDFAKYIIIIVPAFGQVPIFEMAVPHIRAGQIFISMPGNFASLEYAKIMEKKGLQEKKVFFVDTDSIPYACRRVKDNNIFISGMKKVLNAGVYPGESTKAIIEEIQPMFTLKLKPATNVIEAGICNMNMILHPPPVVCNVGWMEVTGGNFSFYREGCSPSVCNLTNGIDRERVEIAKSLGYQARTVGQIFGEWYGDEYAANSDNVYLQTHTGRYHGYFRAPPGMDNRYISEDICFVLLPLLNFAKTYGIKTPVTDAMILLAEVLSGKKLSELRNFHHVVREGESKEKMNERLQKWML